MSAIFDLLILAIVIPALALVGHLYVAYVLAPQRAKKSILEAIVYDESFQRSLMSSIMKNFLNPMKFKKGDQIVEVIPVDLIIERAKNILSDSIQDMVRKSPSIPRDASGNPDLLSVLIPSIPKRFSLPLALLQLFRSGNPKKEAADQKRSTEEIHITSPFR